MRRGFGLRAGDVQQRQIIDGAGPGEFGVVEGRVARDFGERFGERDDQNGGVNDESDQDSEYGNAALDPAIFEETFVDKFSGVGRAADDRSEIAGQALPESAPGHV